MDNSKRGYIPMQEKLDLNKTQGASTPEEVKRMQNVPYASALGSIMYMRVSFITIRYDGSVSIHLWDYLLRIDIGAPDLFRNVIGSVNVVRSTNSHVVTANCRSQIVIRDGPEQDILGPPVVNVDEPAFSLCGYQVEAPVLVNNMDTPVLRAPQ
ncbi:hypothetical protein Tco_1272694 [Tanacetum coccineum]